MVIFSSFVVILDTVAVGRDPESSFVLNELNDRRLKSKKGHKGKKSKKLVSEDSADQDGLEVVDKCIYFTC